MGRCATAVLADGALRVVATAGKEDAGGTVESRPACLKGAPMSEIVRLFLFPSASTTKSGADIPLITDEIFFHQYLIVVATVLFESVSLQAVVHKAQPCVQSPRLHIVPHHGELDEFDVLASKIKYRLDKLAANTSSS